MFKKFSILLILSLLFISVAAVSASEEIDSNLTSDENNLESLEVSEVSQDLLSSEYSVTNDNYGTYFNDDGNLRDNVKSGDTIKFSGTFSDKKFTFNRTVNVIGDKSYTMTNSMFTFLSGASGSNVSDLKIKNLNNNTCGVLINGASNCIIKGCTIESSGAGAYPIAVANGATYNTVISNALTTSGEAYGHGTRSTPALVLFGSNYNTLENNNIEVEDANAIYLSQYGGGPFVSASSNYNLIFNNTIHYNVLPTSWSYGIQAMGSSNNIKSNKIIGAYRGISTTGFYNVISQNHIINLTGADYSNKNVAVGGEFGIVASKYSNVTDNYIINAKIISTGAGISVIDYSIVKNNYVDVKHVGMGISVAGNNVTIINNDIYTQNGVGVHEKDEGSGLTVTGNNITSHSAIGILIEKVNSRIMPSDVTITNNTISTSNKYAIDASGVKSETGVIGSNKVGGKEIKYPAGVVNLDKPSYKFNENKTYIINQSNIRDYINENGNLIGDVDDGVILKFEGTFSNEVIYINKAIKIIGNDAKFLNSTFKVTSGGVWIEGLTIINKNSERINSWGIYVNGASGVKIINNTIEVTDPNAAYAIYVLESGYVEVINNTLFSEGKFLTFTLLVYSSSDCIFDNNKIKTIGTNEKYRYSPESSIEGKTFSINGTEYCVDGNELCIDGVTYCIDGNEVCIDGMSYCLDGNELCIDGVTYCIDGNELVIDGTSYAIDGVMVINGTSYSLNGTKFSINGTEYCIDGNEVCIDGVTYCLDGNELCIDGVTYCIDGNELVINGNVQSRNHVVPEIYRTYGILLLYSSFNEVLNNDVNVTSKLDEVYPTTGSNASENSVVGIDIYYNSHNNTVSNNKVFISAKDNFIYGVGVLGARSGHSAPEGQGASYNQFIGNTITLEGPYATTGIIVGDESEMTLIENNTVKMNSKITYGINLEGSDVSTITGNDFILKSDVAYGIEGYNSFNNEITNNKIDASGDQVYGMVFSGNDNQIIGNDILANGSADDISFSAHDALGSGNAGIYLSGNASNNVIKSNNITSNKGFAILSESSQNSVEDNYLKSEKGNGDDALSGVGGKNNYLYHVNLSMDDVISISYGGSGDLILKVQSPDGDVEGAKVVFYVNGGKYEATVINNEAVFTLQLDDTYIPNTGTDIVASFYKNAFQTVSYTSSLNVPPADIKIEVYDVYASEGNDAEFKVKVSDEWGKTLPNLNVEFYIYDLTSQKLGSAKTDSNGLATFKYRIFNNFGEDIGKVSTINAVIGDSEYYNGANSTGKLIIISPAKVNVNSRISFNSVLATLVGADDSLPLKDKDVSVVIDGKAYSLKTNANGEIILPSVGVGSHAVSISSAKDSKYDSVSISAKVDVIAPISENQNANLYFGNTAVYKIRLVDKNANYLKSGIISINVNGKNIILNVDGNGYATYSVKQVGTYTITAEYNGYKVSNMIVIKPTLTAKNIVKKKAKKIKFTVKVVDKKGSPVKKKKVTFKVKGKKYKAKTNKKGVATVTLKNLKVGKNIITSSYGGCTIKNTIKIKK